MKTQVLPELSHLTKFDSKNKQVNKYNPTLGSNAHGGREEVTSSFRLVGRNAIVSDGYQGA
jgi:hypothetical protein